MNKKRINTYVTYTVKKPVIFGIMVFLGLFLILYLTLTIKTNVINTYDGTISRNTVLIPAKINNASKRVYLYNDRNEAIYPVEVAHAEYKANSTTLSILTDSGNISFKDFANVKIDIPIQQITLFERVFLKGGKINNE